MSNSHRGDDVHSVEAGRMSIRDKIAEMLDRADMDYLETGEGPSSHAMADAILAALPELTAPKETT